ncbi:MAG: asparagine--tRNA ligase [Gemmataceae bacterium]|nr:asparagine--tRNA ligase [Gemmataceae bacterium]MDW8243119.1 asparagine--tRNA ligase [Thermogemmata sp.]
MELMRVVEARRPENVGRVVRIRGWVRTRRDSKAGFSFIEVNDGSCLGNLQILAPVNLPNYESIVKHLHTGASIVVDGTIQASPAKGQATELVAQRLELLGDADPTLYPLQKKNHTYEFLRTIAHLRPRTNTFGAVTRIRHRVSLSIHQFFHENGFYYIHTPIITASDCEGAGALFRVTTLDPARPPLRDGQVDYTQDFFGKPTYLTVSGQLQAEAYACALGKVYTFGPTFRAENSNTTRHLAEFWMVEPEMAFYELADNMDLAEAFLKRILRDVLQECAEDMRFFQERVDPNLLQRLEQVLQTPFRRISYSEAIDILARAGRVWEFPVAWGKDLQSEHERYLAEEYFRGPVILYDYPRSIKPFYMRVNDDGRTVRAMDVLVPGVGEIIGGSQREERADVLEQRMREQGLDVEAYRWYLELRQFGSVPHSGFGLGLERTLLFLTGLTNIRDVIPFPRYPGHAEY